MAARADFVLLALCVAVIALGSLSEAIAFRRSGQLTTRSAIWPIKPEVLHHTKRATVDEDDHAHEEEDSHAHEEEHGEEQECLTECNLAHEFTELAEVFNFRVANSNETCVIELEHCHHDNETEEHGHDEDHGAEEGSEESPCLETYHFFRALLRRLNLTSECCLVNGTHCGEGEVEEERGSTRRTDPAQAYGYGFLIVVLVCAGSLLGIIVVPFVKKNTKLGKLYKYIYALMIALGASALFCDAILHLIPHAFNLHAHDEESSHSHAEEAGAPHTQVEDFIWKACVVILGMYGFFLLEVLLHIWNAHGHSHSHTHSYSQDETSSSNGDIKKGKKQKQKEKCEGVHLDVTVPHGTCAEYDENTSTFIHPGGPAEKGVTKETSFGNKEPTSSSKSLIEHGEEEEDEEKSNESSEGDEKGCFKHLVRYCLNIKPLAWLIILGDGIHNFTDGLAIGAAISQSLSLGLSTAIAVIFHEIPHEFGDFAILLSTGMKWYVALTFNLVSSLTAILGLFVGVAVGSQSTGANNWILAIAAGVFLYIALVDLLPDLIHSKEKGRTRWGLFLMANIGFYISFIVLLLIAIYEEQLNSLIS